MVPLISENISPFLKVREELKYHSGSYDTFIFMVKEEQIRNKIINMLNLSGLGTKILPDAMEWHCSAYWGHALDNIAISNSISTLKILETCIAIPILINSPLERYHDISNKIISIIHK